MLDEDENIQNPILLEEEFEAQKRGEVPNFDIPVVRNAKVEQWVSYFQGRGRKWFHLWLERSGRYVPLMRKILRDHDLPEDLVHLAMIESGFSSKAYSRTRAVGPWQFMKATGRLYGLKTDFWLDERRDPEKSTVAAARHLKDLYDQFQSWKLAAAAYNAGAGKVSRAIKRYKTEDFWRLSEGRYLRAETKHYVPKMIAAALIAKEPEKYGFGDVQYQEPLAYDKIIIRHPINIATLAEKVGTTTEDLMNLNPELNHPVTPPNVNEYELRVPSGRSQEFLSVYNNIPDNEKFQYTAHKISSGDTLSKISRMYGVPGSSILELNNLHKATRLRAGQTLLIPVPFGVKLANLDRRAHTDSNRHSKRRVSKRESLRSVYGDRSRALADAKSDTFISRAKPSAQIRNVAEDSDFKIHVVRRGESLWDIAQSYGITVGVIKQENNLRKNRIMPGKRLRIPSS